MPEDEILIEVENGAADNAEAVSAATGGGLASRYALDLTRPLPEFDTPFAKAYRVNAPGAGRALYALLLEKHFAPRQKAIEALRQLNLPGLQRAPDAGRYTLSTTRTERQAVILEEIPFPTLAEALARTGPLPETLVAGKLIPALAAALGALESHGVVHGSLNPDTVHYDPVSQHIVARECMSAYCGFLQPPAYEPLSRALCNPEGKGDQDATCDAHALAMLAITMLLGRDPFATSDPGQVIEARLRLGTSGWLHETLGGREKEFSKRIQALIQAATADRESERWHMQNIQSWAGKKGTVVHAHASPAKQNAAVFLFQGREFHSARHLAHALFQHWEEARRSLVPDDLVRWLRGPLKNADTAERIESQAQQEGVLISEQRLARIIMALDPEGPIRTHGLAFMPSGAGTALAHAQAAGAREALRAVLNGFTEKLIEHWMELRDNPAALSWQPGAMLRHLRSKALGFGYERCLYDLNPDLPCQGKIAGATLIGDLKDVLAHLEALATSKTMQDQDPLDRHTAAFIASRLKLSSEIHVRAVQPYPHVAGNPQAVMLALLAAAQAGGGSGPLRHLAEWIRKRLGTLLEALRSEVIRKALARKLDNAAKTGDLRKLYKALGEGDLIKRDAFGFQEARRQHLALQGKITALRQGRSITHMAFQKGLRLAAGTGYLVLVGTILLLLFRSV